MEKLGVVHTNEKWNQTETRGTTRYQFYIYTICISVRNKKKIKKREEEERLQQKKKNSTIFNPLPYNTVYRT